jgi:flagellar motor protein MotB
MNKLLITLPALFLGACSGIVTLEDHHQVVENLQSDIYKLQDERDKFQDAANERDELKAKYDLLKLEGDHYQELTEEVKRLIDELRKDNVTYSPSKGSWTFQGDVLFQPGSATLTTKGKGSLKKFVNTWKNKSVKFNIVGHTDSTPIKKSAKMLKTDTNLELGMMRALSVMDFMRTNGISESRMAVNSKGASQPISKDHAKNRRVEIFVLN